MTQSIDHLALLPGYAAVATALAIFLADLLAPHRTTSLTLGVLGSLSIIPAALAARGRTTFCSSAGCSYVIDQRAAVTAVLFAALTAAVLLLSARVTAEPGEYAFLLACSLTGGVVLGAARDLITLIVALETLTLPLYALVALRRGHKSGEGAVTFFVVSVVSTAITLLGAALLYAATGAVHLTLLGLNPAAPLTELAPAGVVLLLAGLGFKVAAVPLHGWAPPTYDGSPLPIAGYLSTASKLGGVIAIVAVVEVVREYPVTPAVLAALAILTMTVGNLGALRQTRMVRLLAWSSIAQAGYVLAALVVSPGAAVAYTIFFVLAEIVAFGAVIAARAAQGGEASGDGGLIATYRGLARRAPWTAAALLLSLASLAGLPPGFAGLFGKIVVIKVLVEGRWTWLAAIVALNAVVALAYYVRVGAVVYSTVTPGTTAAAGRSGAAAAGVIGGALAAGTVLLVVAGFVPQWVLAAAGL